MSSALAQPLTLPCGHTLPNRIAKAAMSERLATPGGLPSAGLAALYDRWGRGGAGLLITGNVMVDARHRAEPGNVVLDGPAEGADADLRAWAATAKAAGATLLAQINHPGRQAARNTDPHPVGPSDEQVRFVPGAFARPRALESAEVEEIVAKFASAAARAVAAGFDGVELHAAHGYLISQFLSPMVNRREDAWGGDPERRRRLLMDSVGAIRAAIGPDRVLAVKLNSADFQRGGFDEATSLEVVAALADAGIDLLEVSGGTYEATVMFDEPGELRESTRKREAYFQAFAEKARRVAPGLPLMVTGGFRTRAGMEQALADGAVDIVGLARPLAVEPDLPARMLAGTAERAQPITLATGWRVLDAIVQGGWYQGQIHRMARGLPPRAESGRLWALWQAVAGAGDKRPASEHALPAPDAG